MTKIPVDVVSAFFRQTELVSRKNGGGPSGLEISIKSEMKASSESAREQFVKTSRANRQTDDFIVLGLLLCY